MEQGRRRHRHERFHRGSLVGACRRNHPIGRRRHGRLRARARGENRSEERPNQHHFRKLIHKIKHRLIPTINYSGRRPALGRQSRKICLIVKKFTSIF